LTDRAGPGLTDRTLGIVDPDVSSLPPSSVRPSTRHDVRWLTGSHSVAASLEGAPAAPSPATAAAAAVADASRHNDAAVRVVASVDMVARK